MFRAIPSPQNLHDYMQRLSARPHHVGSPYDKDNAEWILAKFKEWGWTRTSRPSTCSSPRRRTARSNWSRRCISPPSCRAHRGRRSHLRPARRATAHLQRLLHRWRRHRAAGLCQLRRARRLRGARPPGSLGQGRHRDRALRRLVARHQAQGRRRARRHRLHHLFRPAATTATSRATFSRRPLSPQGRRAARQRHGYAGLSGRSADARRRRGRRTPNACRSRKPRR